MTALRRIRLRHLAQIHFKVAMATWMVALCLLTPPLASAALGVTVIVLAGTTIFGCVVACVGVVMSCQDGVTGRRGYGVELAGLGSMGIGPLAYCITQIVIASNTTDGWDQRGAFVFALWVIFSAVLARAAIVGHHWRLMKKPS